MAERDRRDAALARSGRSMAATVTVSHPMAEIGGFGDSLVDLSRPAAERLRLT